MLYECGSRHLGVLEDYGPEFTAKATEELFTVKVDYHEPAKLSKDQSKERMKPQQTGAEGVCSECLGEHQQGRFKDFK